MSRRSRSRLDYLLAAPFETGIALAALIASAYGLVHPDPITESAIGQTARGLLPVWEVLYTLGGGLTLLGLVLMSVRVEIAGLSLLVGALSLQALAIGDFTGGRGVVSTATYGCLALACCARAYVLIKARSRAIHDAEPGRVRE